MKRIAFLLAPLLPFLLALYTAFQQGQVTQDEIIQGTSLQAFSTTSPEVSLFQEVITVTFIEILDFFSFGGNFLISIIILALLIELITLAPSVAIQLKQKQIHLFHKKLVDRFQTGELALSKTKRELDILYAVNHKLHAKGAVLVMFQILVFLFVFGGLYFVSKNPSLIGSSLSRASLTLFTPPSQVALAVLVALTYLLYSLIKIHIRQTEDYISSRQIYVALFFTFVFSLILFFAASYFPILVSIYFMTQMAFSMGRYLIVEANSQGWGKLAHNKLIKLLKSTSIHKNKWERASRQFNHHPVARHINFHLLEEGISMSMVFLLSIALLIN